MMRQVISRVTKNVSLQNIRMYTEMSTEKPMEKSINQITLLGRVGGDPQRKGNTNHPVVIFSLATQTRYKYMGGDIVQRTEWHKVCVFKPHLRDSVCSYLRKGQRVMVVGKVSYGELKDEEGRSRSTTAVVADDIVFFNSG